MSRPVEVPADIFPDLVEHGANDDRVLWSSPSLSMLGIGCAAQIEMPGAWTASRNLANVDRHLSGVRALDPAGASSGPPLSGPVALGSLPYDPDSSGKLVLPEALLLRAQGGCWVILTGEPDWTAAAERRLLASPAQALASLVGVDGGSNQAVAAPDGFQLSSPMPHEQWLRLVRRALGEIDNGLFEKVVLARRVDVLTNRPLPIPQVLGRLAALYPSCTIFHVEGFLGASPELLVSRHGLDVSSHPLAGTVARSGDLITDEALVDALLASSKDRWEHQVVVDAIASVLREVCEKVVVPERPSVLALRNVSHLGTPIAGLLRQTKRAHNGAAPSALELAARLQPTPAVGGQPTPAAMAWQRANEGFDRGRYAGPVGWVDASGDGEWAIGLRSASVNGDRASLYAGAGIVAGSDPAAELAETQLKLQALLAALVRP